VRPTTSGHVVVRQGLLFGGALGLVDLVRTLIEGTNGLASATPSALGIVAFLVVAAGFVYLGVRVASATGRMRDGAFAGLVAGLVVWVFYVVGALLVTLPNQEELRRQVQAAADQAHLNVQYTASMAVGAVIVTLVLAVFLGAGVSALLGALGGVFRQATGGMRSPCRLIHVT
jgi:hypothetical protein